VKQNRLTKTSAKPSKCALKQAGGAEEVSWPLFAFGCGPFLCVIEGRSRCEVTLEGLDRFGLRLLPCFTKGPVEMERLVFGFSLPNAGGGTQEISGEFLFCPLVYILCKLQGMDEVFELMKHATLAQIEPIDILVGSFKPSATV
jgi:hypothetical protein